MTEKGNTFRILLLLSRIHGNILNDSMIAIRFHTIFNKNFQPKFFFGVVSSLLGPYICQTGIEESEIEIIIIGSSINHSLTITFISKDSLDIKFSRHSQELAAKLKVTSVPIRICLLNTFSENKHFSTHSKG